MAKQPPVKSSRTAREQASAARAANAAAEKRRQRRISIIIGVVIAAVVIGIVGGAVLVSNNTREQSGATANPDAVIPTGGFAKDSELAYGIPYGSNPDAPVLQAWEDLQCPGCQAFETAAGADLKQRADNGEILVVTRITTFLDKNLATDHSRRAAAAYGCAVDAGFGYEYKEVVYANHPATEGAGWTDDQLIGFGSQAGISGDALATFESCFTDRTYLPWANNSTETFYTAGIPATPHLVFNGTEVSTSDVVDPAKFQALIDAANA